jgi:hypothetical protein
MEQAVRIKPNYVQRPPRWAVKVDTSVVDGCGRELQTTIWNLSDGGFMAECEEKLPIGSVVAIEIPGRGPVRAEVRWALGWRFGAMILAEEGSEPEG